MVAAPVVGVEEAFTAGLAAEAAPVVAVEAAFAAGLVEADSTVEAAFVEPTAVTAGVGVVTAGAGADMAEAGVMADSVIPTLASAWALVSTPGPIGLDHISATTDIPIIRTMGAILTALIPATRMRTGRMATARI